MTLLKAAPTRHRLIIALPVHVGARSVPRRRLFCRRAVVRGSILSGRDHDNRRGCRVIAEDGVTGGRAPVASAYTRAMSRPGLVIAIG